jgi:hypothetical protein
VKVRKRITCLHLAKASPYVIINGIFLVVLLGIFSYSALFSAMHNRYPIPSSLEILKKSNELSTGLSRSFSEIMRGRIGSAREYNKYGPRIFLFFLVQFFMRPFFLFLFIRNNQRTIWVYFDAGASIILFLITFWPFIYGFKEVAASLF